MTLFFTMLPLYLLGNFHCLGMCGPLVMMIGQHRYRAFYFIGRLLSFGLAGLLAGEVGAVLTVVLKQYHIPAATSFLFGGVIFYMGLNTLLGWKAPSFPRLEKWLAPLHQRLANAMLRDTPSSTFLMGFFTVALPCGQTLVVFSACALAGDAWVGLFNGCAFALLTSPSLLFAMQTHLLFKKFKQYYSLVFGGCSLLIGVFAICRGLAESGWISHWVLNPDSAPYYHIVVF